VVYTLVLLYTTLQCKSLCLTFIIKIFVAVNPFSLMMEAARTAAHQDAANQQAGEAAAWVCVCVARLQLCWAVAFIYSMCAYVPAE
jgi:hypothetical protein